MLLIDDVQFLHKKEQTQEEFFHTFNALYDAGKQIAITSDRHPKGLVTLEDRLVSRFEWGLITDIQPPDLETRVAILRKKVRSDGVALADDDVLMLIASRVPTNIRELEGCLTRVVAYASVTKRPLDVELAARYQGHPRNALHPRYHRRNPFRRRRIHGRVGHRDRRRQAVSRHR